MKTPEEIEAEGIAAVERGETVSLDEAKRRVDAALERGAERRATRAQKVMRLLREFGTEPPLAGDEMPDDDFTLQREISIGLKQAEDGEFSDRSVDDIAAAVLAEDDEMPEE